MEELIKTFHIETNLLIAQVVNFTIVLVVLYIFAYKPVLKMLNDRTKKIEKGLVDAEKSRKKLEEMTEKEKEVLIEARKQAQEIIKKSENEAKKNADKMIAENKEKVEKMLSDANVRIEQEKNRMMADIKAEVADLVVAATSKIIMEKLDKEKDKELIESVIKEQ